MNFTADELAELQSGVQNIAVFFRLATDPVVRLWMGFGEIFAPANVLDPDGATYDGFGELVGLPQVSQLINGAAERVDFILSGISGSVMQIAAANDADAVKGKLASLGFGIFNSSWQLLGAPHWFGSYTADYLKIDQQPVTDPKTTIIRTITLSCGSTFTGRRRPSYSYFSDADQRARYPGDLFCSFVPQYAHGFNKQWPVFS